MHSRLHDRRILSARSPRRRFSTTRPNSTNTSLLYNGLTEQWSMNESSASSNFLGKNGYNLTQTGNPAAGYVVSTSVPGRVFNGGNQGVRNPADSALRMTNKNMSFTTWVKFNTVVMATQNIFGLRNQGSLDGKLQWLLRANSSGNIILLLSDGNEVTIDSFTLVSSYLAATAYHIAVSFDHTTGAVRARVNGGAVQTFTATGIPVTLPSPTPVVLIGGESTELLQDGVIGCTKLYIDTILSDALLLADYGSGRGVILT